MFPKPIQKPTCEQRNLRTSTLHVSNEETCTSPNKIPWNANKCHFQSIKSFLDSRSLPNSICWSVMLLFSSFHWYSGKYKVAPPVKCLLVYVTRMNSSDISKANFSGLLVCEGTCPPKNSILYNYIYIYTVQYLQELPSGKFTQNPKNNTFWAGLCSLFMSWL